MSLFYKIQKIKELEQQLVKQKLLNNRLAADQYEIRKKLAEERMRRKAVIDFINKAAKSKLNSDGTTTITLTSFVSDLSNLFVSREDLGIEDAP